MKGEMRKRRSRTGVICDILAEGLEGANKTRLMYHCNLNFVRFNHYLQELLEKSLIEQTIGNPSGLVVYRTTDEGRELLRVLRRANDFLSV
jgi:predicted transcriptional regulator